MTGALSNVVDGDGMLESVYSKLDVPTQLSVVELLNNISIILTCPNMDSIDDVFWMGEYKHAWNVTFMYFMKIDISHYYLIIIFIGSISSKGLLKSPEVYILFEIEIYQECHFILIYISYKFE